MILKLIIRVKKLIFLFAISVTIFFFLSLLTTVPSHTPQKISLSPHPLRFSLNRYSQDWLAWIKAGLIDELVMQLYRQTSQEVALSIDNSILPEVKNYVDVAVGIYAGGFTKQKPLAEIQQQMNTVKQYGYGYAIFSWEASFGLLRWSNRQQKENFLKAI